MTDDLLGRIDDWSDAVDTSHELVGRELLYETWAEVKQARRDAAQAPSVELVQALLESENVVDRLTAERDAAYAVIRRYAEGWRVAHTLDKWSKGLAALRAMGKGPTMSDPRWVVDETEPEFPLLWVVDGVPASFEDIWECFTVEQFDGLVAAVRDAARIPELEAEIARLREGLDYIAEPDTLLDANEEAFNEHAARRMQKQARYLLAEPAPDTGELDWRDEVRAAAARADAMPPVVPATEEAAAPDPGPLDDDEMQAATAMQMQTETWRKP